MTEDHALKQKAAYLLASTTLTLSEVAAEMGLMETALRVWQRDDNDFKEMYDEYLAVEMEDVKRMAFVRKSRRVAALSKTLTRLDNVRGARADNFRNSDLDSDRDQGGEEGIVLRRKKTGGQGPFMEVWYEYELDKTMLDAEREALRQIAQELGEYNTDGGTDTIGPIVIEFSEREDGPK